MRSVPIVQQSPYSLTANTGGKMSLLLSFAPWITFWILVSNDSFLEAVWIAFGIAFLLNIRTIVKGSVKILNLGSTIYFLLLAAAATLLHVGYLEEYAYMAGNLALTLIVLISILIKKPFTLQYAREQVDKEHWDTPGFYRTNLVISWGWFFAFVGMTISSALLGIFEEKETLLNWIIPNLFLVAAIKFTDWYPKHAGAAARQE